MLRLSLIGAAIVLAQVVVVTRNVVAAPARHGAQGSARSALIGAPDVVSAFGAGYARIMAPLAITNKQIGGSSQYTGLRTSDYTRAGRVIGYFSEFSKGLGITTGKNASFEAIVATVSQYRNSSGAAWEFNYSFKHRAPAMASFKGTYHVAPLSGVGDQALMVTASMQSPLAPRSKSTMKVVGISFRRGSYDATIVAESSKAVSTGSLMALARLQDSRIQSKG